MYPIAGDDTIAKHHRALMTLHSSKASGASTYKEVRNSRNKMQNNNNNNKSTRRFQYFYFKGSSKLTVSPTCLILWAFKIPRL